jgi:oleate hydratase
MPTSKARLLEKQGQIKDSSTMRLTRRQQLEVVKLLLTRKEDLDNVTVKKWFNDMTSLVFPKYNQYDGFVRPLMGWLKD